MGAACLLSSVGSILPEEVSYKRDQALGKRRRGQQRQAEGKRQKQAQNSFLHRFLLWGCACDIACVFYLQPACRRARF